MLDTRRETTGRVSIVGHRGAAACAPENTLASFREGLAQGADIIELDVQLSVDGHVVALHDGQLDRTTNGHGPLAEWTLAELMTLDAGSWFDPRFSGEPIPTLEEVLAWARNRVPLFIELKSNPHAALDDAALDDAVIDLVLAHGMADQVMIISFDHPALRRVKERAPGLATGVLYWAPVADPVELVRQVGGDAAMPLCHLVTPQGVDACHQAGLAVIGWGGDAYCAALIAAGVDCVNADHPAQVRRDCLGEPNFLPAGGGD